MNNIDDFFMNEAIKEAQKSLAHGGIPIGAVLVKNKGDEDFEILGKGHNRLIQNNSVILHGEMDAIENAGRLSHKDYEKSTLYTTLSPCPMCSGAIILYKIPKVVIGENKTLMGAENFLRENGVEVKVLNTIESKELFDKFIKNNSEIWKRELELVGETTSTKY